MGRSPNDRAPAPAPPPEEEAAEESAAPDSPDSRAQLSPAPAEAPVVRRAAVSTAARKALASDGGLAARNRCASRSRDGAHPDADLRLFPFLAPCRSSFPKLRWVFSGCFTAFWVVFGFFTALQEVLVSRVS